MMRLNAIILLVLLAGCARPDPVASLADARASFSTGDYRTAVIHLQNVLQADPENADARVLLGRIALHYGDIGQARGYLESARDVGGRPEEYALALAEAQISMGAGRDALDLLDLIPTASRGPEYWLVRADAHTRLAEFELAGQALDEALDAGGPPAQISLRRARLAAIGGNMPAAAALVGEAVEADLSLAEAYAFRASLRAAAGNLELAADDLATAAQLFDDNARALIAGQTLLQLVQVQLALNRLDAASESAGRLRRLMPSAVFSTYAEALIAYRRGDFDGTVQLMRNAVNEVAEQPQFLALLGAANMAVGNYGQAEQQFLSILSRNPSDPAAIRLLAEARIRQQRPRAALDALQRIDVSQDTADIGLLTLQGAAYLQNEEPDEAIPYLERALSVEPTNQLATLQLVQAYTAVGRNDEADELMRSAPGIDASMLYARNLSRVLAQLQNGEQAAAEAAVAAALADNPDGAGAHLLAAVYYQMTNDSEAAREHADEALALDESFVPAHLFLAELLAQRGQRELAEQQLLRATEIEPGSVPAWMLLARLAVDGGELAAGEAYLLAAVERSDSVIPRAALARFYLSQGDVDAARLQADAAAEIAPNLPEVRVTRAMVAMRQNAPDEAVDLLRDVEAELPDRASVTLLLAQAQIAANDVDAARRTLADASERMPGAPGLLAALGTAERLAGNTAEAIRIARDLQVAYPQQAVGFALEAELRLTERAYDEAVRLYELAYERRRSWGILVNLVSASRLSSTAGGEEALIRDWLDESPGDVAARLYLAEMLRAMGDSQAAYAEYQRVIELHPDNVMALNNAAWLALELDRAEGLEYALRANEIAPETAAVLDTVGWMLTEQNRASEGLSYLQRATELSPQALEIRYHLGVAQARIGQIEAARQTLEAVLSEPGDFALRESAQALLASL